MRSVPYVPKMSLPFREKYAGFVGPIPVVVIAPDPNDGQNGITKEKQTHATDNTPIPDRTKAISQRMNTNDEYYFWHRYCST